jgi:DNA-binding LacI/PurR family transcriptional regulator
MKRLREFRSPIQVPQDVFVMGIDDDEISAALDLTTLKLDPRAVGKTAIQALLSMMQPGSQLGLTEFPVTEGVGEVCRRASTGEDEKQ